MDHQIETRRALSRDLSAIRNGLPVLRELASKRASVMARQQEHGTRSVAPIPLNMGAWQLLQDILKLVDAMSRALRMPMRMDAEGRLKGLIPQADKLLARPDAAAITELTHQAALRLDRQLNPPPETVMIGPCPACGCDLWCDPTDLQAGYKACDRCRGEWRIKDVQKASIMRIALCGATGTAAAISRLVRPYGLDIKNDTISQWYKRGHLQPVAFDGDKPVFLIRDVWDVFDSQAKRKRRK